MWRSAFLSLGAQLRWLLAALLGVLLAALALPTWSALDEQGKAAQVVVFARAGQNVFTALKFLRPERGTVHAALDLPGPAEPALLASLAAMRTQAAPALDAVLRDCTALHCAADDPQLDAFRHSIEQLLAVRRDSDAAMRQPRAERPPGLGDRWYAASSDLAERLDRLSLGLTERVRLVDATVAELMAVKQLGWLVRDAAGTQRNVYSDGINAKSLSPAQIVQISGFQGRIEAGWGALRELTARQGAPAHVVAAVHDAQEAWFGEVDKLRKALQAALLAGRPSPVSVTDWLRISTQGLDSLIKVPSTAVAEAQTYAETRASDATRRLSLLCVLLLTGVLLGGGGFFWVQWRVTRPIRAITATMRRLVEGDVTVAIAGQARRDEIGEMAAALVGFRDGLTRAENLANERETERERAITEKHAALSAMAAKIEAETQAVLDQVGQRTAALSNIADAMAGSAERTGTSAHDAATVADEALATVQTVAGTAEQLAESIREINRQIGHVTQAIGRAVVEGGEARGTMEALNERVGRIGTVADMITAIAARTNLLALNATIEAARAGEAGKGFAVVASEVKALATQTTNSTKEISRHIGEVRAATGASVTAVQRIETTIGELEGAATAIASAMDAQDAATAEIARNVGETGSAVRAMSGSAEQVSGEVKANGRNVTEVRDTADSLNQAIGAMKHTVTRIVRTSTADADRRMTRRYPLDAACRLIVGGDVHEGRICDLSSGGGRVAGMPALPVGSRGILHVESIDVPLGVVLRATEDDGTVHLAFELDPQAEAALRLRIDALPRMCAA